MNICAEGWESIYASAVAVGCGACVTPEEERIAAADEMLATSIPALVRLGSLAAVLALVPDDTARARELRRQTGAVLRLLHRALAAHGRDNHYDIAAWRTQATTIAWVMGDDSPPVLELIDSAAEQVALAFAALGRDRVGVPENLASAIGALLVAYTDHIDD